MKNESNVGKWDWAYKNQETPKKYGDETTYLMGWKYLKNCKIIEDWGCGFGYFGTLVPDDRYVGVDGSYSKFAKKIVDLETYKSTPSGIFMRHVLEHNFEWKKILINALESFQEKMVLIIFTKWGEVTKVIADNPRYNVPDISFCKDDLLEEISKYKYTLEENIITGAQYGVEHIFYIEK